MGGSLEVKVEKKRAKGNQRTTTEKVGCGTMLANRG